MRSIKSAPTIIGIFSVLEMFFRCSTKRSGRLRDSSQREIAQLFGFNFRDVPASSAICAGNDFSESVQSASALRNISRRNAAGRIFWCLNGSGCRPFESKNITSLVSVNCCRTLSTNNKWWLPAGFAVKGK